MKELTVLKYPDPRLRRKAEQVVCLDKELEDLIKTMFRIMKDEEGIGLAAPQVGVSQRVIVVSLENRGFERLALINPVIQWLSKEKDFVEEGCLSIPDVRADVERSVDAVVKGMVKSGRMVEITAHGLLARVLQHEIDHLNGVLFIDRLDEEERKRVAGELKSLEKQYSALLINP
ncbi:MAG: peptide deformylase [Spirochaetota bacterium]